METLFFILFEPEYDPKVRFLNGVSTLFILIMLAVTVTAITVITRTI